MVHKKKKKIAGRGYVPFHFQRDNVEVCFTGPGTRAGDSDPEFQQNSSWMEMHILHAQGKEA